MPYSPVDTPKHRPAQGIDIVRIGVALIILMHPLHGFAHYADIAGFGSYLGSLGYPFGLVLAWTVLVLQTVCSLALLANRWVVPACIGHMVVVGFGLVHFHYPNGWFVVGGGTGGMEWPFILLACLGGVLWTYWPRRGTGAGRNTVAG
ncbi:DoxX family protein [Massilia sp. Dwa41.01b]|uniref:DoxX family protein n=1 Tax=unclassified Massilia TaxID=2609279 RepID=UPI0016003451|nr:MULTISPECIES: DoxX family protein [unclassified Massilia]QNA87399.1 DoxX family protein [Massilia sp. Dwa41.01b]QNA98305.1 DoxX family protein [Massilia sp. Se16.2.3]